MIGFGKALITCSLSIVDGNTAQGGLHFISTRICSICYTKDRTIQCYLAVRRITTRLIWIGCVRLLGNDVCGRSQCAAVITIDGNSLDLVGAQLVKRNWCFVERALLRGVATIDGVVDLSTCGLARDGHVFALIIRASLGREHRLGHSSCLTRLVVIIAERHVLLVAPDIVFQARIVDERVAIALNLLYSIITGRLNIIDEVTLRPVHKHINHPIGQPFILCREDLRCLTFRPIRTFILIACSHIEVDTSHIALDFIIWLKYGTTIACGFTAAQFRIIILGRISNATYLSQKIA